MNDDEKFLRRCETSPLRSEAIEILCRMVRERDEKLKIAVDALEKLSDPKVINRICLAPKGLRHHNGAAHALARIKGEG